MTIIKRLLIPVALSASIATVAVASSDEPGEKALRMQGTKPLSEIVKQLEDQGYTRITELEFERGVYEVKGRRTDGSWFNVYVDAHSGGIGRSN